jgi:hypothetical protein
VVAQQLGRLRHLLGGGTNEIAMAATRSQAGEGPRVALPDNVRKVLRERLAYRYHIPIHLH